MPRQQSRHENLLNGVPEITCLLEQERRDAGTKSRVLTKANVEARFPVDFCFCLMYASWKQREVVNTSERLGATKRRRKSWSTTQ